MLDKIAPYSKAIAGFIAPGLVAIVAAMQDGSPGGSTVTYAEWIGALIACLVTSGVVFAAPKNRPEPAP